MCPYPMAVGADRLALGKLGQDRLKTPGAEGVPETEELRAATRNMVEVHDIRRESLATVATGLVLGRLDHCPPLGLLGECPSPSTFGIPGPKDGLVLGGRCHQPSPLRSATKIGMFMVIPCSGVWSQKACRGSSGRTFIP